MSKYNHFHCTTPIEWQGQRAYMCAGWHSSCYEGTCALYIFQHLYAVCVHWNAGTFTHSNHTYTYSIHTVHKHVHVHVRVYLTTGAGVHGQHAELKLGMDLEMRHYAHMYICTYR